MFTSQRLVVHLAAQQGLRMERGSHVEGFVVIVGTLNVEEFCVWFCADKLEEVGNTRPAKSSDDVPAFDANVTRILRQSWQGLDLRQCVLSGTLDIAADG